MLWNFWSQIRFQKKIRNSNSKALTKVGAFLVFRKELLIMACMHSNTVKIGEAKCCLECGYTIAPNRKPFFDKEIINYNSEKVRKKANVKSK